jgi:hypothetical protein
LQQAKVTIAQLESETEQYRQGALAGKQDAKAIDKLNNRINQQLDHVASVLEEFPSGTPIRLITPASKSIFYGVVVGIDAKKRSGSPAAPNRWKMRILVADSARQLTVPLSKFNTGRGGRWKPRFKPKIGSATMCMPYSTSSRKRGESTGRSSPAT